VVGVWRARYKLEAGETACSRLFWMKVVAVSERAGRAEMEMPNREDEAERILLSVPVKMGREKKAENGMPLLGLSGGMADGMPVVSNCRVSLSVPDRICLTQTHFQLDRIDHMMDMFDIDHRNDVHPAGVRMFLD